VRTSIETGLTMLSEFTTGGPVSKVASTESKVIS
jgi:hypothetical protein